MAVNNTNKPTYYYCVIAERLEVTSSEILDGPFDISVARFESAQEMEQWIETHSPEYIKRQPSTKRIGLSELTQYLKWKMKKRLIDHPDAAASCSRMSYVDVPLCLLENIIETEFDYHFGQQLCARDENKHYMNEYASNVWTGYGPDYYRGRLKLPRAECSVSRKCKCPGGHAGNTLSRYMSKDTSCAKYALVRSNSEQMPSQSKVQLYVPPGRRAWLTKTISV